MGEVTISASNGRFSASVETYVDFDVLSNLAHTIEGFPANATDTRVFEFGSLDPSFAGGGVRLQFLCKNAVGKSQVDVQMRGDPHVRGFAETSSFSIAVEATAIDTFVARLKQTKFELGSSVSLSGV